MAQILATYFVDHGSGRASAEQIKASIQHFTAFLLCEEEKASRGATRVSELKPRLIKDFVAWREKPHRYTHLDAEGNEVEFKSGGVSGEAINRNLDDVRSGINWAWKNGDLTAAPFIPPVGREKRSGPRQRVLTMDELAAMLDHPNETTRRMIVAVMGTLARPEAVLAWHIPSQFDPMTRILDTNPPGKKQTKKHNAVVPVCDGLLPWLEQTDGYWITHRGRPVRSIKTAWRHMRSTVGLGKEVVAKTVRHTLNTHLHRIGVPVVEIETMAGHRGEGTNRRSYTHMRPDYLVNAKAAIDDFWRDLATRTSAHLRTTCGPPERNANVVDLTKALKGLRK